MTTAKGGILAEQPTVELDDDHAELARRYSLSAEDAKRIRGNTWAERCEDAERLVGLTGERSIRDRARAHLRALQEKQSVLEAGRPPAPNTTGGN